MQEDVHSVSSVLTVKEAAALLKISERSVWSRIKAGKLKRVSVDGRTYIDAESLKHTEGTTSQSFKLQEGVHSEVFSPAAQKIIEMQAADIEHLRAQVNAQLVTVNRLTEQLALPAPTRQDTSTDAELLAIMQTHTELYNELRNARRIVWPWLVLTASVLIAGASGVMIYLWR